MNQTLDRSDVTARFSVAVSGEKSERLGRDRGCGIPYKSKPPLGLVMSGHGEDADRRPKAFQDAATRVATGGEAERQLP
jgi:hypothetical protein